MKMILLLAALNSLTGTWIGNVQFAERPTPVRMEVTGDAGTLSLPFEGVSDQPLTNFRVDDKKVEFAIQQDELPFTFQGTLQDRSISGEATAGDRKGQFELIRIAAVRNTDYFGAYKFANGRMLYVRTWDELGPGQLTYLDDEGRVGPLYSLSDTRFFTGPGLWIPLPQKAEIVFSKDESGRIVGLTWFDSSGNGKKALRMGSIFTEHEISFTNLDVRLSGSLVIPNGKGPFPAMVLVHGSGAVTRDFFGPVAYLFASRGVAVLSFDKRGAGDSQGHWMNAGFSDYAADALAGVAFLRNRKEIDSMRIGLWGGSQAGWIIPEAVSRDPKIAFAVMLSVPGVTPLEQEIQRTEEEMKTQDVPEEEIQKAVAQLKSDIDSLRSGEVKEHLQAQVEKLKSEGNYHALEASGPNNPQFLLWYAGLLDHSPVPALQKMKCPVLVLYGEFDRGVPVEKNKPILEAAFEKSGNRRVSFHVFPKGNHALMLSESGSMREFPYLTHFVPGLFDRMIDWIRAQR